VPRAARSGANVQPFHLAGAITERPQSHAADDLPALARKQDRVVAPGKRGELGFEVAEPPFRPEPGRVLAEEYPKRVAVLGPCVRDRSPLAQFRSVTHSEDASVRAR
jgi:hypothetical protein